MKKNILTIAGILLTGVLQAQNTNKAMKHQDQLPQTSRGNVHVAYQGKSIDQMIYEFMQEEGIPGMTLAIVQAPYIPRVTGYGVTDVDKETLASVKTLWPVGPISQGFAAVATMQLLEAGKLDIQAPINKYLKKIPESWGQITVFQLMQHSTGIADYREQPGFQNSISYSPEQLIAMVKDVPLAFTAGTDVQQSATNFLLLSSVIESAGGTTYQEYVKRNQIDYLGLKETLFNNALSTVQQENIHVGNVHQIFKKDKKFIDPAETTTGYREKENRLEEVKQPAAGAFKGFSDILSSAENISHWDIALAGGILIAKPENRAIIYQPTRLDNGKVVPAMAGWQFYGHKGLMDIKGDAPGHSAFLSRFTDASELVCVTLLANKEGVDLTNLARRIAAAFDGTKLGTGVNDAQLYSYESQFSVDETAKRIERLLEAKGVPVFAVFDHGKNAEEAGLKLRPNKVIVFGSPKVGTKLMQDNPSISLELPLRISVWEDKSGSVWITFPRMPEMAARYALENDQTITGMQTLMENLTRKAANIF